MPKNTDTTDDESDGEQNDKKALTTRAKLAVLALWAWVKPRTKSAVDEARSQLAQASDEIAPQLRGAVDDLHVPRIDPFLLSRPCERASRGSDGFSPRRLPQPDRRRRHAPRALRERGVLIVLRKKTLSAALSASE
jgi:hypothetical protein